MCGRAVNPDKKRDYEALLYDDINFFDDRRNSFLFKDLNELPPSYINYNVAPTDNVPTILNDQPKAVQLIPWRYDQKIKGKVIPMFNSKFEKAEQSNFYYRNDLVERRCVIFFKGYYEWMREIPGNKKSRAQIVFVHLRDSPLIPVAGIYKTNSDGSLGCSVLTTTPLPSIEKVHGRMPYILTPNSALEYISPKLDNDQELIVDWLTHNITDSESLMYYPVNPNFTKEPKTSQHFLNECEPIFEV